MTGYDSACRTLASRILADYILTPSERDEEVDRLTQNIQETVKIELEGLEHRRKTS